MAKRLRILTFKGSKFGIWIKNRIFFCENQDKTWPILQMKNPFEICITKITTQFWFSIFEKQLSKTGEKGFVWVSKKIKTIFLEP